MSYSPQRLAKKAGSHPSMKTVDCGAPLPQSATSPMASPLSRRLSLASLALSFTSSSSASLDRSSPTSAHPASPLNSLGSESTPRSGGLSDIFSSVFKREKQAIWWGIPETEEIRRLEALLADRNIRNELVMDLLASHSDYVLPLRFVTSYAEYRSTLDKKERQMKGRKVLSTFLQPGSMFQLKCIPDEDLVQIRIEHLGMVKTFLLSEMVKIHIVSQYLTRYAPPPSVDNSVDDNDFSESSS